MSPALPSSAPVKLRSRASDSHKGSFGRVMLIGGSRGMAGSISLSSIAALKSGSGLVSAAVPDGCLETVASFHPAIMTRPMADDSRGRFAFEAAACIVDELAGVDAVGIGPGMTTAPGSLRMTERLLHQVHVPRVFDADALNALSIIGWREQPVSCRTGKRRDESESDQQESGGPEAAGCFGPLVLTPHPGELQRLVGVPAGERQQQIEASQELCRQTGVVVVVKGGPTVVVSADDKYVNTTGNPGMATGGSGDVLTGVITSLLGQGYSCWDAARLGVWVHGHAGDLARQEHGIVSMTALEILQSLPAAWSGLT
ncbi:ATP-dependent (S)-NAD(P)H-hydrate dehydratase [Rubripirellula amarantea]|uniref:ADP-dependent (S)-NAD(P)H-hydrate dehydratase n=1 Tax=Rubripirellula amarantea TaxID=2527999 RepID=A0A5C5WSJ3_9BACT|nr:NAD(P)H-hydrate dehydratase [Rubripirellula amarantea]TWT53115.1 ATP-dependent (S)-NAD(P)H-hydrate dehydratase [Rubripirellula amarantea]